MVIFGYVFFSDVAYFSYYPPEMITWSCYVQISSATIALIVSIVAYIKKKNTYPNITIISINALLFAFFNCSFVILILHSEAFIAKELRAKYQILLCNQCNFVTLRHKLPCEKSSHQHDFFTLSSIPK